MEGRKLAEEQKCGVCGKMTDRLWIWEFVPEKVEACRECMIRDGRYGRREMLKEDWQKFERILAAISKEFKIAGRSDGYSSEGFTGRIDTEEGFWFKWNGPCFTIADHNEIEKESIESDLTPDGPSEEGEEPPEEEANDASGEKGSDETTG